LLDANGSGQRRPLLYVHERIPVGEAREREAEQHDASESYVHPKPRQPLLQPQLLLSGQGELDGVRAVLPSAGCEKTVYGRWRYVGVAAGELRCAGCRGN